MPDTEPEPVFPPWTAVWSEGGVLVWAVLAATLLLVTGGLMAGLPVSWWQAPLGLCRLG